MKNNISGIINGLVSGDYTHGSDEWLGVQTATIHAGRVACDALAAHLKRINPDDPHGSYRDRMVAAGVWATWQTKDGKNKPIAVVKRKAQLVSLYGREVCDTVAEWRVLCTFEAIRVSLAAEKAVEAKKHQLEADAAPADAAPADAAPADAAPADAAPALVQVETSPVREALGHLNKVIAQMEMDDSLSVFVEELKIVAAKLVA